MPDEALSSSALETCATHGLHYDPHVADGCTLCRRLVAPSSAIETLSWFERIGRRTFMLGAFLLVGTLFWFGWGRLSGVEVGPNVADGGCVGAKGRDAERCVRACGPAGQKTSPCPDLCMSHLASDLQACALPPADQPGMVEFLYSTGDAPGWPALEEPIQALVDGLDKCGDPRGSFVARVAVGPDGDVLRGAATVPQRDVQECTAAMFAAGSLPPNGKEYAIVLRGLARRPPPAPETKPEKPREVAKKPEAIDYLGMVNQMNPTGENGPPEATAQVARRDLDVQDPQGWTPLMKAIQERDSAKSLDLIAQGANVHIPTKIGNTPLRVASSLGLTETVRELLQRGAEPDRTNEDGDGALHGAAHRGHLEIAKMLIQRSARVNHRNKDGDTPLHFAALKTQNVPMLELLLENRADIEARGAMGRTPLGGAAAGGYSENVRFLIDKGANISAKFDDGHGILFVAAYNGHSNVVSILERAGAR